jgi:hypothetical protein
LHDNALLSNFANAYFTNMHMIRKKAKRICMKLPTAENFELTTQNLQVASWLAIAQLESFLWSVCVPSFGMVN